MTPKTAAAAINKQIDFIIVDISQFRAEEKKSFTFHEHLRTVNDWKKLFSSTFLFVPIKTTAKLKLKLLRSIGIVRYNTLCTSM